MSTDSTTIVLVCFLAIFVAINLAAARFNRQTPGDYYLAGRSLGPFVLLMTTAATGFSTWTLLGAAGEYYRNGVWFLAFTCWAVMQGLFIWIFGGRIFFLSRKYNFITPGDMAEHYYGSVLLRTLFAIFGIIGLVPYMLIQITGGAKALNEASQDTIPYAVGVVVLGAMVGLLVAVAGGRGAAWTDTFMGIFFGSVLFTTCIAFIAMAGWSEGFQSVAAIDPGLVTVGDDLGVIVDTCVGFTLSIWIMPQAWQKFCSASSASALVKTAAFTPLWNSWLMALSIGVIGILAHSPGLIPSASNSNADMVLPMFFVEHAPLLGIIVVVAIIAAGMSTVNSQLLSSASLVTTDLYERFADRDADEKTRTQLGRGVVIGLTALISALAFVPAAQGFLVPVASSGLAIVSQLVPAALGPLIWRRATKAGAIASIATGEAVCVAAVIFGSPLPGFGPATTGLIVGLPVFVLVSLATQSQVRPIQDEYHDALSRGLYGTEEAEPEAAKV